MAEEDRPAAQIFSKAADLYLQLVLILAGLGLSGILLLAGGVVRKINAVVDKNASFDDRKINNMHRESTTLAEPAAYEIH
jgi:hypothetical protein